MIIDINSQLLLFISCPSNELQRMNSSFGRNHKMYMLSSRKYVYINLCYSLSSTPVEMENDGRINKPFTLGKAYDPKYVLLMHIPYSPRQGT